MTPTEPPTSTPPVWSIGLPSSTDHAVLRALAPRIEQLGFSALWLHDTANADALDGLRVVAEATTRLRLVAAVAPAIRKTLEHADFGGIPAERFMVAVGSGAAQKPVEAVVNSLVELRAHTTAPVVTVAHDVRTSALASRASDGVVLAWLTPQLTAVTAATAAAAHRAERGTESVFHRAAYVRALVDPAALAQLQGETSRDAGMANYAAQAERLGIDPLQVTARCPADAQAYSGIDELVLRPITQHDSFDELHAGLELLAGWRHTGKTSADG